MLPEDVADVELDASGLGAVELEAVMEVGRLAVIELEATGLEAAGLEAAVEITGLEMALEVTLEPIEPEAAVLKEKLATDRLVEVELDITGLKTTEVEAVAVAATELALEATELALDTIELALEATELTDAELIERLAEAEEMLAAD